MCWWSDVFLLSSHKSAKIYWIANRCQQYVSIQLSAEHCGANILPAAGASAPQPRKESNKCIEQIQMRHNSVSNRIKHIHTPNLNFTRSTKINNNCTISWNFMKTNHKSSNSFHKSIYQIPLHQRLIGPHPALLQIFPVHPACLEDAPGLTDTKGQGMAPRLLLERSLKRFEKHPFVFWPRLVGDTGSCTYQCLSILYWTHMYIKCNVHLFTRPS